MKIDLKSEKIKYLNFGVILLIIFSIGSQIYSLINLKGFWLDEWFILYNIKFHSYSELFNNLFYSQQFPRVYLAIQKFVIEFFNYNYFAIRVIPFLIQVVNILFVFFVISKIVYPSNKLMRLLFVLFFLSFHTTFFYFAQLKAYTADMFFALMSIYYFFFLSKNYKTITIKSPGYLGMLFLICSGLFLSYTFPIVFAPILIFLFFTFLADIYNKEFSLKPILPILVFLFSLLIFYSIDLRFVLSDKGQYHNFNMFTVDYSSFVLFTKSLSNILWLFTSMFFFDKGGYNYFILILLYFVKVIVLISAITGFILILWKHLKKIISKKPGYLKSFNFANSQNIDIYFLVLFFLTIILYFFKMLPLGTHRINYFCFVFVTYFLIIGIFFWIEKFKKSKYFLIPLVVFAAMFPAIQGNLNELENNNLNFDQKIYENVGNAIKLARDKFLPIIVSYNEFYPASIMEGQESLMIKSHHLYLPKDSIPVIVVKNGGMENKLESIQSDRYIRLFSHYFLIVNRDQIQRTLIK